MNTSTLNNNFGGFIARFGVIFLFAFSVVVIILCCCVSIWVWPELCGCSFWSERHKSYNKYKKDLHDEYDGVNNREGFGVFDDESKNSLDKQEVQNAELLSTVRNADLLKKPNSKTNMGALGSIWSKLTKSDKIDVVDLRESMYEHRVHIRSIKTKNSIRTVVPLVTTSPSKDV